eukprot:scaffold64730_cov63-Phaeocystis_antarctica.AAC.4
MYTSRPLFAPRSVRGPEPRKSVWITTKVRQLGNCEDANGGGIPCGSFGFGISTTSSDIDSAAYGAWGNGYGNNVSYEPIFEGYYDHPTSPRHKPPFKLVMHDESATADRTTSSPCLAFAAFHTQLSRSKPCSPHSFVDMIGRPRKLKEGDPVDFGSRVAALLLAYNVLEGSQLLRARRYEIFIRLGLPLLADDEDPTWPRPSGYGRVLAT